MRDDVLPLVVVMFGLEQAHFEEQVFLPVMLVVDPDCLAP